MPGKIKVAHVIRVFSYGGAEVLLREFFLNDAFKEHVISDLYILDHKKLGLVPEVKPHVQKIHYYKITSLLFIFEYIKFLYHIHKGRYDVVHAHLPVAAWMTIPAKLFCRKTKFIYSEHNLVSFYSKYNYYLSGMVYGFFDCLIFVSHEVGENSKQNQKKWFFKTKKSVIILNGIDTDKFSNAHRAEKNIAEGMITGLVARFRPQKRVDKWVQVAAEIKKLTDKINFLMVGDGPDDEMLRQKIAEKNLQSAIQLSGQLKDTYQAYKQIDIFLLTSDFEGLPLALMEAMSCGCVPVVSNVGGIKQLEFNGFGYKYVEFNAASIASKIVSYLENPQQFITESKNARAFIEHNYSLHKQIYEILELYRKITGKD